MKTTYVNYISGLRIIVDRSILVPPYKDDSEPYHTQDWFVQYDHEQYPNEIAILNELVPSSMFFLNTPSPGEFESYTPGSKESFEKYKNEVLNSFKKKLDSVTKTFNLEILLSFVEQIAAFHFPKTWGVNIQVVSVGFET